MVEKSRKEFFFQITTSEYDPCSTIVVFLLFSTELAKVSGLSSAAIEKAIQAGFGIFEGLGDGFYARMGYERFFGLITKGNVDLIPTLIEEIEAVINYKEHRQHYRYAIKAVTGNPWEQLAEMEVSTVTKAFHDAVAMRN